MKTTYFKLVLILIFIGTLTCCKSDDNENETATEICDNGKDDDGDGFTDCEDFDCVCEICDNGIDDDSDGFVDGEDSDCN